MQNTLTRIQNTSAITNEWDISPWNAIDPMTPSSYMAEKPEHFPQTQVKIAYDDEAIYVKTT